MLDRTIAPPFNRTTSFELIHPEKKILKNGAELYFVLGGTQEVSKVEIIFPAGRWIEKTWGAAYFTSNLLSKGTRKKSSFEIVHLLDMHGAHLEIQPGLDYVSVSLYILNKNFQPAILLLLEMLTESIFPQDELDLLKSIFLQNLKVNYEKTSFQASRLVRKNLFGETHPYGKELEENDVNKVTQASLINHYANFKKATILVSGKYRKRTNFLLQTCFHHLNSIRSHERIFRMKSQRVHATLLTKRKVYSRQSGWQKNQFQNCILTT